MLFLLSFITISFVFASIFVSISNNGLHFTQVHMFTKERKIAHVNLFHNIFEINPFQREICGSQLLQFILKNKGKSREERSLKH